MSENTRVLIVDQMHESILPLLTEAGFQPDYRPKASREEIIKDLSHYCGLIIRSKTKVDEGLVKNARQLKFVARAGAGLDRLDSDYLTSRKIEILNAPEGNRNAVGEHALGLLLNLLNNITVASEEVKAGKWKREENRGYELRGKVVGVFGFGNTGKSFARKLSGMDCKVVAYDKYKTGFAGELAEEVTLEEFREQVEILSINVPLREDTSFFFNEDELANYPKLKIIINTARGEILKLADTLPLLREGKLLGLGLDVLENEKLDQLTSAEQKVFDELKSFKNVIFTPHVAGWTHESYIKINEVLVSKIKHLKLL